MSAVPFRWPVGVTQDLRPRLATSISTGSRGDFRTADQLHASLQWSPWDIQSGRCRTMLYRFLVDHVPIISACVWTWVRLSAAPGAFRVSAAADNHVEAKAAERLGRLTENLFANVLDNRVGLATLMPELFGALFRDGIFGAFLTVMPDGTGVDRIIPVDALRMHRETGRSGPRLVLELDERSLELNRPDFYYLGLNSSSSDPFGRSILQPIPFVSYIEQQLVRDMQRSNHNAGYHRLHIKITPPERMAGESDSAYTNRINGYFDSTVEMIRSCEVDDNPVTWDNVAIEYIGPDSARSSQANWFVNHRATIEDICAGTNLAPYLLGYSYGATTTWSNFKFDVVMRQVRSVQAEVARFLNWIAAIDLALAGIEARAEFVFDNTFAYQATEHASIQSQRVDSLLKLYQAGLIDEKTARERAAGLF
ncbi:MAG: hypothetical protein AB1644_07260 [Candidatus Zixiibacteriota bacterium]